MKLPQVELPFAHCGTDPLAEFSLSQIGCDPTMTMLVVQYHCGCSQLWCCKGYFGHHKFMTTERLQHITPQDGMSELGEDPTYRCHV